MAMATAKGSNYSESKSNNNSDSNNNQYIKHRSIVEREFRKGSDPHPFLLLFLFFMVCLICFLWDFFCFTRASVRGTLI